MIHRRHCDAAMHWLSPVCVFMCGVLCCVVCEVCVVYCEVCAVLCVTLFSVMY